jgi:hypothetical protein
MNLTKVIKNIYYMLIHRKSGLYILEQVGNKQTTN